MDFRFSDEQLAVAEAATGVFGGLVDPERIGAIEQTDDRIDRELWQALADADLLGIAVPESEGGAGYGLMELCLLLEAQGNVVAPVPLWATLVLGALPIAHFGSDAQRSRWLPGVVSGDVILTAALTGSAASPTSAPAVRATPTGDGWALEGTELAVPQAHLADRIVVPARTEDGGVLLALVDPTTPRCLARTRGDHQPRDPSAPASRRRDTRARRHPGRSRHGPRDPRLPGGRRDHRRCARSRSACARPR